MNIHDNEYSNPKKIDKINLFPPSEKNIRKTSGFNKLFNEYSNIEDEEFINDLPQQQNLYEEEINYNIDTAKNKESQSSSDKKRQIPPPSDLNNYYDNYNEDIFNNNNNDDINDQQNYIKKLEKKIREQTKTINNLLEYKNLCEKRIKQLNPSEPLPITKKNLFSQSEKINTSSNFHRKEKNFDELYSKCLKLSNDIKYLNSNNITKTEVNKIKKKYNDLKNEYRNLYGKIKQQDDIIKEQKSEIESLKTENSNISKIKDENEENNDEIIKNLKSQVETFRKNLVLSQAMVNSLKSEIEQMTIEKNNETVVGNSSKIRNNKKYSNGRIKNSNNDENEFDNNGVNVNNKSFNNNRNNSNASFNDNDFNYKDKLLANVLEENNKLRDRIKNIETNNNNTNNSNMVNNSNQSNINNNNNNDSDRSLFENKFMFFNDYITKIKKNLQNIYYDIIPNIFSKYLNGNKLVSEKFKKEILNLKNIYKTIKNIEPFNLDVADDEKLLMLYNQLFKLINEEFEKILNVKDLNNNNEFINIKEKNNLIDLIQICSKLINDKYLNQLVNDALNLINNISRLLRKNNLSVDEIDNQLYIDQENKLQFIKNELLSYFRENNNGHRKNNIKLTYEATNMNKHNKSFGSQYYFNYDNNKLDPVFDHDYEEYNYNYHNSGNRSFS